MIDRFTSSSEVGSFDSFLSQKLTDFLTETWYQSIDEAGHDLVWKTFSRILQMQEFVRSA